MHILQSAVYMQHTVILPLGQAALLVAELSERMRPIIAVYLRFCDICIYIYLRFCDICIIIYIYMCVCYIYSTVGRSIADIYDPR